MTKIWTNEIPTGWVLNTSTYTSKYFQKLKGSARMVNEVAAELLRNTTDIEHCITFVNN